MSRNGSGVYSLPAGNPVVTGTTISSTWANNTLSDIGTALTQSIASDGQTTPTANLPMGGFKHTNVANATAITDYLSAGQAVNGTAEYLQTVSGTNTIAASGSFTPTGYVAGQNYRFIVSASNTGAVTLNVAGLGAKDIKKRSSGGLVALVANDLVTGVEYSFTYDGTQFVLNEKRAYSHGADIASASTINLDTATGDCVDITGTTAITAITLAEGEQRVTRFTDVLTLTNGASLVLLGSANVNTEPGDYAIWRGYASGVVRLVQYSRASGFPFNAQVQRGYIDGLILSTAGSSSTMSISAGVVVDSTNNSFMKLASSISKTTSAWAVGSGNGGLDTGAIANSTWYYFYAIKRPDTGVVDVVFSTNSSTPTLPANYTVYRYIGAGLTNGSAQWVAFFQVGNEFYWSTPILDVSTTTLGTTSTSYTLSIPRGRRMKAKMNGFIVDASATAGAYVYIREPSIADLAPSLTVAPLATLRDPTSGNGFSGQFECWSNTSAQISARADGANRTFRVATLGWVDNRGGNA